MTVREYKHLESKSRDLSGQGCKRNKPQGSRPPAKSPKANFRFIRHAKLVYLSDYVVRIIMTLRIRDMKRIGFNGFYTFLYMIQMEECRLTVGMGIEAP